MSQRDLACPSVSTGITDKDLQALLDAPETDQEKRALDALVSDPEVVLAAARKLADAARLAPQKIGRIDPEGTT